MLSYLSRALSQRRGIFEMCRPLLAPKKKPGKSDGGPGGSGGQETLAFGADHVFNIYNGEQDVKPGPDTQYPKWLWSLTEPQKTYGELESVFVYGRGIEKATLGDYRRFRRQHRKLQIKLNNKRLEKRLHNQETKLIS